MRRSALTAADWTAGQGRRPEDRQAHRDLPDPQGHQALLGHRDCETRRDHQAPLGRPARLVREEPRAHPGHRPDPLGHPACRALAGALVGALEVETPAEGQADVEEW